MEGSTSHNNISKSHVPASLHHWTHMSWQTKHLSCKFLILPSRCLCHNVSFIR